MRRALLIARREYLAYVRTIGFWLSLLILPALVLAGGALPAMIDRAAPTLSVAVVDLTPNEGARQAIVDAFEAERVRAVGRALRAAAMAAGGPKAQAEIGEVFDRQGEAAARRALERLSPRAAMAVAPVRAPVRLVEAPVDEGALQAVEDALRPYLTGERRLKDGGELDAAVIVTEAPEGYAVRLWSAEIGDRGLESRIADALGEHQRARVLDRAGVPAEVRAALEREPVVQTFSPKARDGEVGTRDRLPGFVGFVLGMALWSAVVSGASLLMNSVMEEKANRILEVLLASASPAEILTGKVLGAAAVTATVLTVWAGLAGGALFAAMPGLAQDLAGVLTQNGLAIWLVLYLTGGYLMYAVLFAAIGAFCETPREAQTLLGPVMILLSVPIVVMNLAIRSPDLPIVRILSWVPPFTPFLMTARAPTQPPLIELIGTFLGMVLFAWLIVWLCSRAFRAGALTSGGFEWRAFWAGLRGG
jgi:ABC-2 type transport system permease protein